MNKKNIWWEKSITLVEGCSPVSAGCDHCWSAGMANRFRPELTAKGHFNGKIICRCDRLDEIIKRKKPTTWVIWNDLFHKDVPFEFIDQVLAVTALCSQHIFQILTKRPERRLEYFSAPNSLCTERGYHAKGSRWGNNVCRLADIMARKTGGECEGLKLPLPNVWHGITAENQEWYDKRRDDLRNTPAAIHFISYEPAMGSLVIPDEDFEWLDWGICGGESGPGARPMQPDWARILRDQFVKAGKPFFFKQWGEWVPDSQGNYSGYYNDPNNITMEVVDDEPCYRVGKKKSGRLLDGKIWDQMPEVK